MGLVKGGRSNRYVLYRVSSWKLVPHTALLCGEVFCLISWRVMVGTQNSMWVSIGQLPCLLGNLGSVCPVLLVVSTQLMS